MDSSTAHHHHHQEMGSETLESMLVSSKTQQLEKKLKPPSEEAQKCPRCDSTSTKFCYYNNYSLSQPRYFCKSCRRYWTKGGTLRNVPVGGGCRKASKRSSSISSSASSAAKKIQDSQQPLTIHSNLITPLSTYHNDHHHQSLDFSMLLNNTNTTLYDVLGNHHGVINASSSSSFDGFKNGFFETTPNGFHHQNMYYGNVNMGGVDHHHHQNGEIQQMGMGYEEICNDMKDGGGDHQNRVLLGFPWQSINGGDSNMVDLDIGRQSSWINGFGSSNWHGVINSPLV